MSEKSKVTIVKAHAKTNLWLRVLDKREDGFHNLETRMVSLSLADELQLSWTAGDKVEFTCSDSSLPTNEDNLVVKAVRAMEQKTNRQFGIKIHLDKKIPSGAGLGGGSSDAAAIITAINQMGDFNLPKDVLAEVGAGIGSDIPFFIYQKACDVSGRGEIVQPVADDDSTSEQRLPIVLMKPQFSISTPWAYQNLAKARTEMAGAKIIPQVCPWGRMENDLEYPVYMKFPLLAQMKDWLLRQNEIHAAMLSGSGSTVFGILRHFDGGEPVTERARAQFGSNTWFYCGYTL